jgi:hypothetical protein
MAQTPDHAIHVQLPVGRELHFEQNFAFQFQVSCFVGINRVRLVGDFDPGRGGAAIDALWGPCSARPPVRQSPNSALTRSAPRPLPCPEWPRHRQNRRSPPFLSSPSRRRTHCLVPGPPACRTNLARRRSACHWACCFARLQPIRIAEAARLHFRNRSIHRGRRRTALRTPRYE